MPKKFVLLSGDINYLKEPIPLELFFFCEPQNCFTLETALLSTWAKGKHSRVGVTTWKYSPSSELPLFATTNSITGQQDGATRNSVVWATADRKGKIPSLFECGPFLFPLSCCLPTINLPPPPPQQQNRETKYTQCPGARTTQSANKSWQ